MAHSIIAFHGTPEEHERFIHQVSHWKYEAEGDVCKGFVSPYVSELRVYDVRLPKAYTARFLRDVNALTFTKRKNLTSRKGGWRSRFSEQGLDPVYWLVQLVRKCTSFRSVFDPDAPKTFHEKIEGYPMYIGTNTDQKQRRGIKGEESELL